MTKRYSDRAIIAALEQTRGLIKPAAAALGCAEITIRRRVRDSPAVLAALQEARAALVDLAEEQLASACGRGESWAVCMVLKNLGRTRGWSDKVDVSADVIVLNRAEMEGAAARVAQRVEELRARMAAGDFDIDAELTSAPVAVEVDDGAIERVRARIETMAQRLRDEG